jgi:uncharacterized NAD-dependent epimerase/dehydratase family protein
MDGAAIVYCEKAFNTHSGKTAHGLVRLSNRYEILAVIDSTYAGQDAGMILDGKKSGIPVFASLEETLKYTDAKHMRPKYFIIGFSPKGGRLPVFARTEVRQALIHGLNIDSGLHDFLSKDDVLSSFTINKGLKIRDICKTQPREHLHTFSGKISEVSSLRIAVLGTDSVSGKRTTAWIVHNALNEAGIRTELIGTGQTAWFQGARYGLILDTLPGDFVSGEIEHAIHEAWKNEKPEIIIIEGQGSLMNPANPRGLEIIAAGRPDLIILQHVPTRREYYGSNGFPVHPLQRQIEAVQTLSGARVLAITINHEEMDFSEIEPVLKKISKEHEIPSFDLLTGNAKGITDIIKKELLKIKK